MSKLKLSSVGQTDHIYYLEVKLFFKKLQFIANLDFFKDELSPAAALKPYATCSPVWGDNDLLILDNEHHLLLYP